jgi:methyl-accepting chemotaxis protein
MIDINKLGIGKKLTLGFGVILLLVVLLAVLVVARLVGMDRESARIEADLANKARVSSINLAVKDNAIGSMELLLNSSASINEKIIKKIEERNAENAKLLDALSADLSDSEEDQKLLGEMKKQKALYVRGLEKVIDLVKSSKQEEAAYVASEEMIPMLLPFLKAVKRLDDYQQVKVEASTKQIQESASSIRNLTILVGITVVLIGLFSAISIIRSITGPLNKMRSTIINVGKTGDFTQRVSIAHSDEVGETAVAFDALMGSLQQTLSLVLNSAAKVLVSAQTLSSASGHLATSASSQSESTATMAAAVEQMTVTTNQVSDSAKEALDISRKSGKLSTGGGEIINRASNEMSKIAETVRKASTTIEEVGDHSNQISTVVQLIKDIADQTNLLALNAAIEAARAGEQGRGFAVVADEVRKLAERTAKATDEISRMIELVQHSAHSAVDAMSVAVKEVGGGVTLANQAGETIIQIKDGAGRVVNVVSSISLSLTEQCSANESLSKQVEIVAQMTEENSQAANETSIEASKLKGLASDLQVAVGRFKI